MTSVTRSSVVNNFMTQNEKFVAKKIVDSKILLSIKRKQKYLKKNIFLSELESSVNFRKKFIQEKMKLLCVLSLISVLGSNQHEKFTPNVSF